MVATAIVPILLVRMWGHRGVHAARSLVFPGAGLVDTHPWIAGLLAALAIAATIAWMQWGLDWPVLTVVVVAVAMSGLLSPAAPTATVPSIPSIRVYPPPAGVARAAHEFPLVMIVMSAIAWLRVGTTRFPGHRRLLARRFVHGLADINRKGVPDRSRCAALLLLAGVDQADPVVAHVVLEGTGSAAERRARRIGLLARGRRGDPFAIDHAHARAAHALCLPAGDPFVTRLAHDAQRSAVGLPASEPGWVRPLDAALVAIALSVHGHGDALDHLRVLLDDRLALRRGHRPAWLWTPLAITAGRAPVWEHAAATGIARCVGVVGDADWLALRSRILGAAARGTAVANDERLIAAGRIWLTTVVDPEAARIVTRPTIANDPLAVALDTLAGSLARGAARLHGPPRDG
jgi:hypothetical protein